MKLGLWNRLAIVATVLALLIAPPAVMIDIAEDLNSSRDAWYNLCIRATEGLDLEAHSKATQKCIDERYPDNDPYSPFTWENWRQFAFATLVFCGVFYLMIWGISATVRWVWRGREVKKIP